MGPSIYPCEGCDDCEIAKIVIVLIFLPRSATSSPADVAEDSSMTYASLSREIAARQQNINHDVARLQAAFASAFASTLQCHAENKVAVTKAFHLWLVPFRFWVCSKG